jgi:hypothetical protein
MLTCLSCNSAPNTTSLTFLFLAPSNQSPRPLIPPSALLTNTHPLQVFNKQTRLPVSPRTLFHPPRHLVTRQSPVQTSTRQPHVALLPSLHTSNYVRHNQTLPLPINHPLTKYGTATVTIHPGACSLLHPDVVNNPVAFGYAPSPACLQLPNHTVH